MGSLGGENEGKTKHQPLRNLPLSFAHSGNGSRGNYVVTGHHSETQCGYAMPLCTPSIIGVGDCRCAGAQDSREWPRCGLYRYVSHAQLCCRPEKHAVEPALLIQMQEAILCPHSHDSGANRWCIKAWHGFFDTQARLRPESRLTRV